MKTLAAIAYEAAFPTMGWPQNFEDEGSKTKERWEAAAQAVRAAVIEECAKVCEVECEMMGQSVEHINGSGGAALCAEAIRSLK